MADMILAICSATMFTSSSRRSFMRARAKCSAWLSSNRSSPTAISWLMTGSCTTGPVGGADVILACLPCFHI
jgi:hypothetical protein